MPDTDTIMIQGHEFTVPVRYAEGHPLKANEAKALNQTFHEALRNNFAGKVKAKNEEAKIDIKADEYENLPDETKTALQAELDRYAEEFEFNVRTGGGGTSRDPVLAEARVQVRRALKDALKTNGQNWKDVDSDKFEEAVTQALEANPQFMDSAKRVVEERRNAASMKLNLGGAPLQQAA